VRWPNEWTRTLSFAYWQNFAKVNPRDKALVAAEFFATNDDIGDVELEAALQRGLDDVKAGRVRTG